MPAAREGASRISTSARVINALAGFVARDRSTSEAFDRAIANNRRKGAALPPRSLRRHAAFRDQQLGPDRVFRLDPHAAGDTPLRLLYLHGGAYVNEIQAVQWGLVAGLLKRLPAPVVAPVYPLAPENGWREGLASARRVYIRLVEEVGAENIAVFGDSAGGGLALALAQQLRDAGDALPAALALFSPWLDVSVTGDDQPELEKRDPVLTIGFLRRAGRHWAKELPLDDPRVSPLFGDHTMLPPTIVFSGTRDVLDSDSLRLAQRNPDIVHRHYPEMMHVWPTAPFPEGRQALDEAVTFLCENIPAAALSRDRSPSR